VILEVHTGFQWGILREGDYLEGCVVGRIILERICEMWNGGMDWFDLA
jgi:hypothetical protein